jgi:hypothetical protein
MKYLGKFTITFMNRLGSKRFKNGISTLSYLIRLLITVLRFSFLKHMLYVFFQVSSLALERFKN